MSSYPKTGAEILIDFIIGFVIIAWAALFFGAVITQWWWLTALACGLPALFGGWMVWMRLRMTKAEHDELVGRHWA